MHAEELQDDGLEEAMDEDDLKSVEREDQAFWYCRAIQNWDTYFN